MSTPFRSWTDVNITRCVDSYIHRLFKLSWTRPAQAKAGEETTCWRKLLDALVANIGNVDISPFVDCNAHRLAKLTGTIT